MKTLPNLIRKVMLLVGCFLFSIQVMAQSSDSLCAQLARKWVNAKAYALKIAAIMPAEHYDFKPVADVMSFKEQLLHITDNMQWLSSTFLINNKINKVADTATGDKVFIVKKLENAYNKALLGHYLNTKQLDEIVPFFAGPMTRRQILMLMHDHQTHHVGQLIVYLRLKGFKPPAYVGW